MTRKRKELRPNRFSNLVEQVGDPDRLLRRHEKSVADFGAKANALQTERKRNFILRDGINSERNSYSEVEKLKNFTKTRTVGRDKVRAVIIMLRVDRGRS